MSRKLYAVVALGLFVACGDPPLPVQGRQAPIVSPGVDSPFLLNMVDQLTEADDRTKALRKVYEAISSYERCHAEGDPRCGQRLIYGGLCDAFEEGLSTVVPAFAALGLPAAKACEDAALGVGPGMDLKCCTFGSGCQSAFNEPEPINCEGNPLHGSAAGTCVPVPGGPGCVCGHQGACSVAAGFPLEGVNDPLLGAFRLEALGLKMMGALPEVVEDHLDEFIDYVSFRGFREHAQAVKKLAPFTGVAQGLPPQGVYHANDGDVRAAVTRAAGTVAISRVLVGIPNLVRRFTAVSQVRAGDEEEYLAGFSRADEVLRDAVGEFGLRLLRAAEPTRYALLAKPLPDEPPTTPETQGGGRKAQPPQVSLSGSPVGGDLTINLSVADPQAADNPDGSYPAAVDWGDDVVEGLALRPAVPGTARRVHRYAQPGSYQVRVFVANSAGLVAAATKPVQVLSGIGGVRKPSSSTVRLDLEATVQAGIHGRIYVDVEGVDASGVARPLGLYFVAMGGGVLETVSESFLAFSLENHDLSRLKSLRLRPVHQGALIVFEAKLSLGPVTVTRHASPGHPVDVRTAQPTGATVRIGDGPAASASVEPGTGRLLLPADGAVIEVPISS